MKHQRFKNKFHKDVNDFYKEIKENLNRIYHVHRSDVNSLQIIYSTVNLINISGDWCAPV